MIQTRLLSLGECNHLLEHGKPVLFNTPAGIICGQTFGAAAGNRVVFHFHGQISSRLEALYLERAAAKWGLQLIALDRQGFGNSPPSAFAGLEPWPAAVVAIANELGIGHFGVMGVSAGAKYALALALAVPERVTGVKLASSFGPVDASGGLRSTAFRVRMAVALYKHAPLVGDAVSGVMGFALRHNVEALLRVGRHIAPPTERRMLDDEAVRGIAAQVMRASVRDGARGVAQEFRILVRPWNLALDQIQVPVAMWHGEEDVIAPMTMAESLASSIPGSRLHRVPNAGHVSLIVNHADEIIASAS